MTAFRSGALSILIATDVSARGIDIQGVGYVVNYDLPESSEHYVHRVGRTGRGTEKGQAISFCAPEEQTLLEEIEANLGKPIHRLEISKSDYQYALAATESKENDWQALLKADEELENHQKKAKVAKAKAKAKAKKKAKNKPKGRRY